MKRFWGFVQKEWYHIFRDKRTLLILFGMPIAQILLFGYAVTNEVREAGIAILDHSHDVHSQGLVNRILTSNYFRLEANLASGAEIEPMFQTGKIKQVLVIPANFGEDLQNGQVVRLQMLSDATDPNLANTLQNYLSAIVQQYQLEFLPPGMQPLFAIQVESHARYNPELQGVFLFVPGLITIILMLVSAMMTSISITREKEMGTMEILLVSPMKPMQIILGKVTPYIFLSLINAIVILVLGKFVFGVPVLGSPILLIAESLLFIISALALGILISTVAKTQQVALLISLMALMLPTILLSGFMFPVENMPLPLQAISKIMPASWFIIIVKNIMLKGVGFLAIWKETLILFGFTIFFLAVSMKKFQVRLE